MIFLISCGGTGGHLSPGIALAEGLVARGHRAVLLISRKKVDARLVEKYPQLTFVRMPGAPFTLRPAGLLRFCWEQTAAFFLSLRQVRTLRPGGIVGFGGFTTAGIIVAGALYRVPVALHEANRVPGRAIRLLGRLARRVYLPPGISMAGVTDAVVRHAGLPVRREIVRRPRAEACAAIGLDPARRVLLILGGSQGASALNDWARRQAEALALVGIQVCCITGLDKGGIGERDFHDSDGSVVRSVFLSFSDRMGDLLSAADLVVSRAGAGTLAELARCGTPAVLVPYPHAADNHQEANAAYFAKQGGGVVVNQTALATLDRMVPALLADESALQSFRRGLQSLDQVDSLEVMLDDLEALTQPPGGASTQRSASFIAT